MGTFRIRGREVQGGHLCSRPWDSRVKPTIQPVGLDSKQVSFIDLITYPKGIVVLPMLLTLLLILSGIKISEPLSPLETAKQGPKIMLNTFTIKKADGTTDVVYSLQGTSQDAASYIDASSSLASPRTVKVSHNVKPIGSSGSDRHTVIAQSVALDTNNVAHVMSASLTWTIPRASVATDTLSKDVLAALVNYLALSGVKDALIDGIIP